MCPTRIIFLPVLSNETISHYLKMAEELISNLGYDAPQSDTKRQNPSDAFSPETASCIWVRFTPKISSKNLMMKRWKNFLIIMKLSYQARW